MEWHHPPICLAPYGLLSLLRQLIAIRLWRNQPFRQVFLPLEARKRVAKKSWIHMSCPKPMVFTINFDIWKAHRFAHLMFSIYVFFWSFFFFQSSFFNFGPCFWAFQVLPIDPAQGLYRYSKELQLLRHVMAGVPGSGPSPASRRVCRAIEAFGAGPSSTKRWLKVAGTQKAKASDGGEDVKMASWHPAKLKNMLPKKCYQVTNSLQKGKARTFQPSFFRGLHKISGIQYIMRFIGEIWKFCIEISKEKGNNLAVWILSGFSRNGKASLPGRIYLSQIVVLGGSLDQRPFCFKKLSSMRLVCKTWWNSMVCFKEMAFQIRSSTWRVGLR